MERARVREALPAVLVPEWPEDKRLYPQALRRLDCFDKPAISEEDRQRAQMYSAERRRTELKTQLGSVEAWLQTLDVTVKAELLNAASLGRLIQLFNKTNQMNLSTRRMTEQELLSWADAENRKVWSFHVADKFGSYGLTGILGVEIVNGRLQIVDFVLSCRVMGRKVEETMLHVAVDWARSAQAKEVYAAYLETAKNKPCLNFFQKSGLKCQSSHVFVWDVSHPFPLPSVVRLSREPG
jgi:FkbH-like protein